MYEDVLLPFDVSDGAAVVLHHAAEIANWADATIHVLFVADTTRDSVTVVENQVIDALVQQGEDTVEEAEKTLRTLDVTHDSDVVQGNPAPTIAEYAERYDHDLIVMPTGSNGSLTVFRRECLREGRSPVFRSGSHGPDAARRTTDLSLREHPHSNGR